MALELKAERKRLTGQCGVILAMLRQGRATNVSLSHYSLKYTSRLSDLRKRGNDIRVVGRNRVTGLTWYALFQNGEEVPR
jgi:hypothetical protein